MKALGIILALSLIPSLYGSIDPFASAEPKLRAEVSAQKPFQIEFVFADLAYDLPLSADGNRVVTEEFLKAARKVSISVSSSDIGMIEREDGTVIFYRTKDDKGNIQLSFSVKTRFSGVRELSSDLILPMNEWVVLGGLKSERTISNYQAESSQTLYYSLAIRVTKPALPLSEASSKAL